MKQINEKVRLCASSKNWIDGMALSQLQTVSEYKGAVMAVGLPDLHPGKGGPVGAALAVRGWLYPSFIGNDCGCGIGLWRSDLPKRKLKLDKWASKLSLDSSWDGDTAGWLARWDLGPDGDTSIGTIGGGNHFAELQQVEQVMDAVEFKAVGLDERDLVVLVHSGSRGMGQFILEAHVRKHQYAGIAVGTEDACEYLGMHDKAVKWAKANRALIAHRFLSSIRSGCHPILDASHNFMSRESMEGSDVWVHRKGAVATDWGAVVIPGSRGALSYLVRPTGPQELNAYSIAHGAGRKWARSDCKARLDSRYSPESLQQTDLGGRVICEDKDLIYEEAPQAYKSVEVVVQDLVESGLVKVVASFKPLITYKVRRS